MYQSGRAGDEAKKHKSPAKSGRVGITVILILSIAPPEAMATDGFSLMLSVLCFSVQRHPAKPRVL